MVEEIKPIPVPKPSKPERKKLKWPLEPSKSEYGSEWESEEEEVKPPTPKIEVKTVASIKAKALQEMKEELPFMFPEEEEKVPHQE